VHDSLNLGGLLHSVLEHGNFSNTDSSKGSVAISLRCGGIFNNHITANLLSSLPPSPSQPFYGPFSGTTRVSRCQKRTSGLYGAREDLQMQTH